MICLLEHMPWITLATIFVVIATLLCIVWNLFFYFYARAREQSIEAFKENDTMI